MRSLVTAMWKELNQLLCSNRIDGYALLDPSTGNVMSGFGTLYEGFMVPDRQGRIGGVEERLAMVSSLVKEDTPRRLTVKNLTMIVVRRDESFLYAVGPRKRYSVSVHSIYAGVLVVAYSHSSSLGLVLDALRPQYGGVR